MTNSANFTGDQYEAIQENTNYIDRLQKRKGKEQSAFSSLCDVFGETKFSIRWLLPLAPTKRLRAEFQAQINDTMDMLEYVEDACVASLKENNNGE